MLLLVGGLLPHGPDGASTSPLELCAASQLNQTARYDHCILPPS